VKIGYLVYNVEIGDWGGGGYIDAHRQYGVQEILIFPISKRNVGEKVRVRYQSAVCRHVCVTLNFDLRARWPVVLELGRYVSRGYSGIVLYDVLQSACLTTALGKGDTSAMHLQFLQFSLVLVCKNAQFGLENVYV
jgi:hypothetical protein